ncbi:MAG: HAMP domain-containing protein [Chitinispirillaceae bacterium]|nr:HAMP domain-containing protein [Chitinispirillaceae bacterium]
MRRLFTSLELEWKILIVAAALFIGFLWPVQNYFMHRMQTLLEQSIDPQLDTLLRSRIALADTTVGHDILTSIERHRQWQAMIPVIIEEQRHSIVWFSIVLFIVFLGLALYILNRLTAPLKRLSAAADAIGKGKTADIRISSGGSLRRLEASMAQMQEELRSFRDHAQAQGMEKAWRDIARIMAHEIKNPLTPIRLTLDRVMEKIDAGDLIPASELKKYVDRITLQIEHLEELVNEFRSFAREPEVRIQTTDLEALLREVADGMKPSVTTEISGAAQAAVDPRLLGQAFLNLWKNAAEAGAGMLRADIREEDDSIIVTISDNGPGIPRERLERVWIPYVTFKKGGTGLGLPIVKRLIEAQCGTISLTSICEGPDHGVTITIRLRKTL